MSRIRIEPAGLRWLLDDPAADLCAHGRVVVHVDEKPLITSDGDDLAVSTGALHLLRAVQHDHTPEAPLAEHLVPHCGHSMAVEAETGLVVNIGCPGGVNWWVRHEDAEVVLTRADGAQARVSAADWAGAVAAFADEIDAFYATSPAREPMDEYDAEWFRAMRDEWRRLRSAIHLP